ncbi:MAG: hypothetical protein RI897_2599, partial [Verrucomicrobiota bacterium]
DMGDGRWGSLFRGLGVLKHWHGGLLGLEDDVGVRGDGDWGGGEGGRFCESEFPGEAGVGAELFCGDVLGLGSGVEHGDEVVLIQRAFEGEESAGIVGEEEVEAASAEDLHFMSEGYPVAVEGEEVLVDLDRVGGAGLVEGVGLFVIVLEVGPEHGFTAIGVIGAPHAHFVAVVDVGGSGAEELEGDHLFPAVFFFGVGGADSVIAVPFDTGAVVLSVLGVDDGGADTGGIVGGEEVLLVEAEVVGVVGVDG